jgi:hypothetical protein
MIVCLPACLAPSTAVSAGPAQSGACETGRLLPPRASAARCTCHGGKGWEPTKGRRCRRASRARCRRRQARLRCSWCCARITNGITDLGPTLNLLVAAERTTQPGEADARGGARLGKGGSRAHPPRWLFKQQRIPRLSRRRPPEAPADTRRSPQPHSPKALLTPGSPLIPAQPRSGKPGLSRRRSRVRVPSLPSKPVQNGMFCCLPGQSSPALEIVARSGNAPKVGLSVNHAVSAIRRSTPAETPA